jgi:hypothetical protein
MVVYMGKPRQTIAEIVRTNSPIDFFLCLSMDFLHYCTQLKTVPSVYPMEHSYYSGSSPCLFVGSLAFLLQGFCSHGRENRGKGSYREVGRHRQSNVPRLYILIWLTLSILFGSSVFTKNFALDARPLAIVGIIQYALIIWTLMILIISLSEVQGFSLFKAVLNMLFAIFVVVAVVWVVFLINWGWNLSH